MTVDSFARALRLVLVHEGGFVNHPKDPGGETMKGVIQTVYDAYRDRKGQPRRSVRQITNAELNEIYREQYWNAVRGDDLPAGVDYAIFDYAVNSGPGRAVKELQRALGVKADGVVALGTLTALQGVDCERLINDICDRRLRFLKSLKTWGTFGKGWASRVAGVRKAALEMAEAGEEEIAFTAAPLPLLAAAKGSEGDQAQLKTADGAGLSMTTAGGAGTTALERAQDLQPHIGDSIIGRAAIAACVILMAVGIGLLAYAQLKRVREKGGLGGYLGSFLS